MMICSNKTSCQVHLETFFSVMDESLDLWLDCVSETETNLRDWDIWISSLDRFFFTGIGFR